MSGLLWAVIGFSSLQQDEFRGPPIFVAARKGDIGALKKALASGADPNLRGIDGERPLHWAIYGGQLEAIKILVKAGAKLDNRQLWGSDALAIAAGVPDVASTRRLEMVKLLFKLGAKVKRGKGPTALSHAVFAGDVAVASLLIDKGLDPNELSFRWINVIHLSADDGDAAMVDLLAKRGANVNAATSGDKYTPLMFAVYSGRRNVVQVLLRHKANPNAKDKNGRDLMTMARLQPDQSISELLLKAGAKESATSLPIAKDRSQLAKLIRKPLMPQVKPLVKKVDHDSVYSWRAPNDLIMTRQARTRQPGVRLLNGFEAGIYRIDPSTGKETFLKDLSEKVHRTLNWSTSLKFSPDGRFLAWSAKGGSMTTEVDGAFTEFVKHDIDNDIYWRADSKGWYAIHWDTEVGRNDRIHYHGLDEPATAMTGVDIPKDVLLRPFSHENADSYFGADGQILTQNWRIYFDRFTNPLNLVRLPFQSPMKSHPVGTLSFPFRGVIDEMEFSPDGSTLACLVYIDMDDSIGLCLARPDGSGIREIGFIKVAGSQVRSLSRPGGGDTEREWRRAREIGSLQWSADGKRLSFIRQGVLYGWNVDMSLTS